MRHWILSFCLIMTTFFAPPSLGQIAELEVREGAGVSNEVETIYSKAADYLAKTQKKDGSWKVGQNRRGDESAGVAALATMAFLSTGEDPNFGRYAKNVRAAVRLIVRTQNKSSGFIKGNMYVHGFAMLALSEAYGAVDEDMLWAGNATGKQSLGKTLKMAVKLAVTAQRKNPSKGWRYVPNGNTADTSVVGAVLMGLLAARNAGIDVPDSTIDDALKYMKQMASVDNGNVAYSGMAGLGSSEARSSIACLVFSIGKRREWKELDATKKFLVDQLDSPTQTDWPFYERYYKAQALFQADYKSWQQWNRNTIRILREIQSDDGQIGDSTHGAAYATSMSLLALALNYRFLPIYER